MKRTWYIIRRALLEIATLLIPVVGIVRVFKRPRMTLGAKIAFSAVFLLFWSYAFVLFYALGWALMNSLKTNVEFWNNMNNLPAQWLFSNYPKAFELINYNGVSFVAMFINSTWFAVGSALLSTLSHAVTGYIFAKYDFPLKKVAFSFILFTIALPVVGTLPSMYQIISALGLKDSPLMLLSSLGGFGGNFLITYAFFKGVDKTYSEAARIDGANQLTVFTKIMLPQARPMLFSIGLLAFIANWNSYESQILFLSKLPTLSSGLYLFRERMTFDVQNSSMPIYFAGVMLSAMPVILLIICFHDKILKNVSAGGIKG